MKRNVLLFSVFIIYGPIACTANHHSATMPHGHNMEASDVVLTEAGNDVFGTIQEVITRLNNDPATDWSQVNIEALRQHLIDMHEMTLNVDVISQKPVPNGLEAVIKPTTERSAAALERVFKAHPAQLMHETNWDMQVENDNDRYILTTRSKNPKDIDKIRGLGYIGLMAYGSHHQPHHWGMATGKNPHAGHH